jgi:sialic acid synthase SpsE
MAETTGFENAFMIGREAVGRGAPPLFLPDIGTFFGQDIDLALWMVEKLVSQGIRTVKGEILHSAEICLRDGGSIIYLDADGAEVREPYRALIERKVVPLDDYARIFSRIRDAGGQIVVSLYDREGADFAVEMGVAALKIATSNITHAPLIEDLAGRGLPLVLDTGGSTMEEISRAVGWIHQAGCRELVVEHSPPAPPASVRGHNLRFMQTLGSTFGVPFGLSDHHAGDEMMLAAVALGASVIETGVYPNAGQSDQDVAHAVHIDGVGRLVRRIHQVWSALGDGVRHLPADRIIKPSRMGLVANRPLQPGDRVTEPGVGFAFPCRGIPAEEWPRVRGWRMRTTVASGEPILWDQVKPPDAT